MPCAASEAADPNGTGTDQDALFTETCLGDAGGGTVANTSDSVNLLLRGVEERRRKPVSNIPANDDQIKIHGSTNHAGRSTDESACATHDVVCRFRWRTTGDRLNCQPRRFGVEASTSSAMTTPTTRFDDDMADLPGVSADTVEQFAVDHDSARN